LLLHEIPSLDSYGLLRTAGLSKPTGDRGTTKLRGECSEFIFLDAAARDRLTADLYTGNLMKPFSRRCASTSRILLAMAVLSGLSAPGYAQSWRNYGRNPQHTALAPAAQRLEKILWSTPVDLQPQYTGDDLYVHYGSPLITANNTIIVTVKTGVSGGFRVEGHNAATGALMRIMHSIEKSARGDKSCSQTK